MGMYLSASVGFGIVMDQYGDFPEGVYEVFSEDLEDEDFDWDAVFTSIQEQGIDVVQEYFGVGYESWAMVVRESATSFYDSPTVLEGPIGPDGNEEKYQAELDKALAEMGLADLNLKGAWLLLLEYG